MKGKYDLNHLLSGDEWDSMIARGLFSALPPLVIINVGKYVYTRFKAIKYLENQIINHSDLINLYRAYKSISYPRRPSWVDFSYMIVNNYASEAFKKDTGVRLKDSLYDFESIMIFNELCSSDRPLPNGISFTADCAKRYDNKCLCCRGKAYLSGKNIVDIYCSLSKKDCITFADSQKTSCPFFKHKGILNVKESEV